MLELLFILVVGPVFVGVCWALHEIDRDVPYPIIHERRRPWPNPFV